MECANCGETYWPVSGDHEVTVVVRAQYRQYLVLETSLAGTSLVHLCELAS